VGVFLNPILASLNPFLEPDLKRTHWIYYTVLKNKDTQPYPDMYVFNFVTLPGARRSKTGAPERPFWVPELGRPWEVDRMPVTVRRDPKADRSMTVQGDTYMTRALLVEKIQTRQEGGLYVVEAFVRNLTYEEVEADYIIEFRGPSQDLIVGHKRAWQPFKVASGSVVVLSNSANYAGTMTYKLFIVQQGAPLRQQTGEADPPR
jgi:hypothetical protein